MVDDIRRKKKEKILGIYTKEFWFQKDFPNDDAHHQQQYGTMMIMASTTTTTPTL